MSFTESDKTKILRLKSSIASYYNLQMKKIGDKQLESYFFNDCVISGGMISSLFHEEAVNDIDVYAKEKQAMDIIKNHILLKDKNIQSFEQYSIDAVTGEKRFNNITQKAITDNAVTLTNDVQFIYMDIFSKAQASFDYVHCQPYYDIGSQKLYISEAQYLAIKHKQLIPTNAVAIKPARQSKYEKRGWKTRSFHETPVSWSAFNAIGFIAQEIGELLPGSMYINSPT